MPVVSFGSARTTPKPPPIRTYGTPNQMPHTRLDQPVYDAAIAAMILVDTDAVIVDSRRQTFWLARRRIKPMKGLPWWIGGKLFPGEHENDGMSRSFKRETGLDIAPLRFRFQKMIRYFWPDREQTPQETGRDDLVFTFVVQLTDEELTAVQLDEEYEKGGLKEYTYADLEREGAHQAVLDLWKELFQI
ncbi:MAG: NUDIX domain-containing protein [bacterium]|nr:NUDIX domain-containing protein [bacterium]